MTCVVGLIDADGGVWLGSDSAGVAGYDLVTRADLKVFAREDAGMRFGFTSSFRMGQLLRYALQIPEREAAVDVFAYLVRDFIPAVRDCLRAGGFTRIENNQEQMGEFLVGVAGRLFHIGSDFQVGETTQPYTAIGCGAQVALGALYATEQAGLTPPARLELALRAAMTFSAGVRTPFTIIGTTTPASG